MKGVWIFVGAVIAAALFCWLVPFVVLPNAGIAMALPVITVPGETLCTDCFGVSGLRITNTLVGTVLADVLVLLFVFAATWRLKEVPGRMQGLFEMLTDALYGLVRTTAGTKHARRIFPLMATIFLFLLFANWLELVPGVDSIGVMHCAEDGMSGYPRNGAVLEVNKTLFRGDVATEADYEACHAKDEGHAEDEHAADDEHAAEGEAPEGGDAEGEAAVVAGEAEALAEGAGVRDDIYVVTPFIRAAATDLNMTLGLALIAVVAVQIIGVQALGAGYFAKFVNIPALGNMDKNPMGLMDFAVGFLEIISEVSRIISFGFRLFGNIFAGQVLLFVIPFLAGALIPLAIYGFELFVGVIQAFVFAMLFVVFAAMATIGHGDHEEGHE